MNYVKIKDMVYNIRVTIKTVIKNWLGKEKSYNNTKIFMVEADSKTQAEEISNKHLRNLGYKDFCVFYAEPIPNKSILNN